MFSIFDICLILEFLMTQFSRLTIWNTIKNTIIKFSTAHWESFLNSIKLPKLGKSRQREISELFFLNIPFSPIFIETESIS